MRRIPLNAPLVGDRLRASQLPCPKPLPGHVLMVTPPGVNQPFAGLVLLVTDTYVLVTTPQGTAKIPQVAYPPEDVAIVHAGDGRMLWTRAAPSRVVVPE